MDQRARSKSVISPLQTPGDRWVRMVESGKDFTRSREFNTIGSWIGALSGATMVIALLLGWLTIGNNNSKDIQALQGTVAQLSAQVSHLADKIDQGPRTDQMKEVDRHLSALDGRMDGMDTRIQSDERSLTKVQADVDNIRNSSDARLTGHVR